MCCLGFVLALAEADLAIVGAKDLCCQRAKMLEAESIAVDFSLRVTQGEHTVLSLCHAGCPGCLQSPSFRGNFWRRSDSRSTWCCRRGACTGVEAPFPSNGDSSRDRQVCLSVHMFEEIIACNRRWREAKVREKVNRRSSWRARANAREF